MVVNSNHNFWVHMWDLCDPIIQNLFTQSLVAYNAHCVIRNSKLILTY